MIDPLRIFVGVIGTMMVVVAMFSKKEFRWGRGGHGPRIEPQWVGRAFFALIGLILLYATIFKL